MKFNSKMLDYRMKGKAILTMALAFLWTGLYAQVTTVSTADVTICTSGNVQLNTSPSGGTSYSYAWSPTTGLSNSAIANPTATVSSTITYIVTVTDIPTSNTVTDTVTITVQNIPPPVSIYPDADTICQGDSLQMNLVNSPYCQTVTGSCQGTSATTTVGTGNFFGSGQANNPFFKADNFFQTFNSTKHQYVFRKSELNSLGIVGPITITALSWDIFIVNSETYQNLTFKMGCINDSVLSTTYKTGLSTVYNPKSVTLSNTAWTTFAFDQGYVWDGESNIVLEICFANSSADPGQAFTMIDQYFNGVAVFNTHATNACGITTGSLNNRRPNTRFQTCEFVAPASMTYSWAPATGLSNSSIRNPIAFPSLTTSYILTAIDNNGCTAVDTSTVFVAPNFNLSVPSDTALCSDDTLSLFAVNNAGAGSTIMWSSGAWIEADSLNPTNGYFNASEMVYLTVESQAGCMKSDSFMVSLVSPVDASIQSKDTTICAGDSIPLLISTNSYTCATYSNVNCPSTSALTFSSTSTFPSGGVTVSPFDATFSTSPGQKKQFLILASELAGISNSNVLVSLGFNMQSVVTSVTARNGFTIKMGCTNLTNFPFGNSNFVTGLQTVFNSKTINVGSGWNDLSFDNAFVWDGTSNVIVEICWQNSASLGAGFNTLNFSTTSFASTLVNWNSSNFCSETAGSFATTVRPEMRFGYCSSPPNSAYDFLWTPSAGLASDTVPEPMASPSVSGYYKLTVSDPLSGCQDEDSILIDVAPDFNTTVTSDTTLCSPDTVQLNVAHNSASPVTFNWMPATEVSNTSIFNPTTYVNDIKEIISEVTSNQGCIKWDTINLSLIDQIDLSIIAPTVPACEGDSVPFDATHNIACGQSNSNLCNPSSTLTLGSSTTTSSSFNITPFLASDKSGKKQFIIRKSELNSAGLNASAQLSSLSFEISALGKTDYQNFSIRIGCTSVNAFTGSFVGNLKTVFEPKDVILVSGNNWFDFDRRFNWDGQSNLVIEVCYLNDNTGTNSEIYYTQSTPVFNCSNYTRGNSVCGSGSGTAYNRRPNIEFKYCTVTPASFSYLWSPQGNFNDPGLKNPKALVQAPGWYKLTLTDLSSGCLIEDSVQLNLKSFDLEALKDTTLCSTMNYQLNLITNAVQPKYRWFPGSDVSNDTIKNPKVIVDNGVNYIVQVTDSSGCVKEDTVEIVLLPRPTANINPASVNVCRYEDVQLNGSGGGTYTWTPANGLSSTTISSPVANVSDSSVFYLKVTNSFGCTDKDSVVINVFPSPILDLGPDTSICNEGFIQLNAGPDFETYLWQDNSTNPTFWVTSDGVYWINVSDVYGCDFRDSVVIDIAPVPRTDIDYQTVLCSGDSVVLDAKNPGALYLWSTGETSQQIVVKDSGFFWVEIDDGKCLGKDSTIVSVYDYPVSYLSDIEYYCEKEYPFGMTLIAGPEEYRYHWSNGNVTNSIIVTTEGMYSVEITNGDKCLVEKVTEVRQSCSEVIFVPNSFTPNADWKNDVFKISALNMDKFEFRIFNRWGEVIFYSTDADFEWDGTFKGKPMPDGVYVWRMDYTMKLKDGSFDDREETGSITLIR